MRHSSFVLPFAEPRSIRTCTIRTRYVLGRQAVLAALGGRGRDGGAEIYLNPTTPHSRHGWAIHGLRLGADRPRDGIRGRNRRAGHAAHLQRSLRRIPRALTMLSTSERDCSSTSIDWTSM